MFDIETGSTRNCEGVNRREFLRVGALTAFGLSLPGILRHNRMRPWRHGSPSRRSSSG
jgi:hypothetical protein